MVREDSVWIPAFSELQQSVTITGALAGVAATAGTAGTTTAIAVAGADSNPATGASNEDTGSTRRLPFAQGDTVRSLLERVGGVGPLADLKGSYILRNAQAIPVDLYALVMLRDLKADKAVELGDTIVVPFRRPNILIEGAVFKPGPVPVQPQLQHRAVPGAGRRPESLRAEHRQRLPGDPERPDEGVRARPQGGARGVAGGAGAEFLAE